MIVYRYCNIVCVYIIKKGYIMCVWIFFINSIITPSRLSVRNYFVNPECLTDWLVKLILADGDNTSSWFFELIFSLGNPVSYLVLSLSFIALLWNIFPDFYYIQIVRFYRPSKKYITYRYEIPSETIFFFSTCIGDPPVENHWC